MDDTEKRLILLETSHETLRRLEKKVDQLVELASTVRRFEEKHSQHSNESQKIQSLVSNNHEGIETVRRELAGKTAWVRGAVVASTLFWMILQGAVAYILTDTLDQVGRNTNAVTRHEQILTRTTPWHEHILPKESSN